MLRVTGDAPSDGECREGRFVEQRGEFLACFQDAFERSAGHAQSRGSEMRRVGLATKVLGGQAAQQHLRRFDGQPHQALHSAAGCRQDRRVRLPLARQVVQHFGGRTGRAEVQRGGRLLCSRGRNWQPRFVIDVPFLANGSPVGRFHVDLRGGLNLL